MPESTSRVAAARVLWIARAQLVQVVERVVVLRFDHTALRQPGAGQIEIARLFGLRARLGARQADLVLDRGDGRQWRADALQLPGELVRIAETMLLDRGMRGQRQPPRELALLRLQLRGAGPRALAACPR